MVNDDVGRLTSNIWPEATLKSMCPEPASAKPGLSMLAVMVRLRSKAPVGVNVTRSVKLSVLNSVSVTVFAVTTASLKSTASAAEMLDA